jgi:hypothetical protein
VFLENTGDVTASFALSASVAVSNSSTEQLLANCNLKEGPFVTFAATTVTVPADGTGTASVAHASMQGWVSLEPGETKTVEVECFGGPMVSGSLTAFRAGVLIIQ